MEARVDLGCRSVRIGAEMLVVPIALPDVLGSRHRRQSRRRRARTAARGKRAQLGEQRRRRAIFAEQSQFRRGPTTEISSGDQSPLEEWSHPWPFGAGSLQTGDDVVGLGGLAQTA